MGAEGDFNRDRAELFEALGHPTRIRILQALSGAPMGFSELKREAGIDSNGLMAFHLNKLDGLVKTTPEGSYTLSDEGKEALRIMSMEPIKIDERIRQVKRRLKKAAIVALILLIASVTVYSVYSYEYAKFDSAAMSLQISGFKITNITIVESNATEPSMAIACEIEFYVMNPTEYAYRLALFDLYMSFERQDFGWNIPLEQTSPCFVQPNSTTAFKVATEYYPIHGYFGNDEYEAGQFIYSYLTALEGRYQPFGMNEHDLRTMALFSTDFLHAYKQKIGWGSMWQDV